MQLVNGAQTLQENVHKDSVNIVWLKRDLRLSDHEPLAESTQAGLTLLYYVFEPLLIDDPHYEERHWRFIWQSLQDLNIQLSPYNTRVYVYYGDAIDGLNAIQKIFKVANLYSHEEVGLLSTFNRDKDVKNWCKTQNITWFESATGAVMRGMKNRNQWDSHWQTIMKAELSQAVLSSSGLVSAEKLASLPEFILPVSWTQQYIAGVGADPRGGRHFNIEKQSEIFDPDRVYQTAWTENIETSRCQTLDSVDASDWPIQAKHNNGN